MHGSRESTKAFKNRKKKLSNLETNFVPDFSFKAMKTIVLLSLILTNHQK